MINNYSILSDDELLLRFRQGDELAGGELAERYRPMVKRCTRPYFLMGGDGEDLIQEGMIGLVCSIQGYDMAGGASFKSYAELCVRRRIMDAVRSASRNKHMPLNSRLSLEELSAGEGEAEALLSDERYNLSPEELIIEQEQKDRMYKLCAQLLSPLEKKVLGLYLDGLSYEEMAQRLDKPAKSVDSALQRIKKKLSGAARNN